MGSFPPGAGIAVARQVSAAGALPDRTSVFLVDKNGSFSVLSVDGVGAWSSPSPIGAPFAFVPGSTPAVGWTAPASSGGVAATIGVFLVDKQGQLNLFWAAGHGPWQGPHLIGPAGHFPPGAIPAVSPQFGTGQIDVFLLDKAGKLNVMWGGLPDGWNGPIPISEMVFKFAQAPHAAQRVGARAPQTDLFIVDDTGDPNVFSVVGSGAWSTPQLMETSQRYDGAPAATALRVGTNQNTVFMANVFGSVVQFAAQGGGAWSGPTEVSALGLFDRGARVAASQQFGVEAQTDVFAIDKTGRLNVFWIGSSGGWNGPYGLSGAGFAPPTGCVAAIQRGTLPRTDVFLVDNNGDLIVFYVEGTGKWQSGTIASSAPQPKGGLRGSSNYIIYNDCKPLVDLTVVINITEDMVCQSHTGSTNGFGFQLNGVSPPGSGVAEQQYFIYLNGNDLYTAVNWWDSTLKNAQAFWGEKIWSFPGPKLPSGWRLEIFLTADGSGNVNNARLSVFDPGNALKGSTNADLNKVPRKKGFETAAIAPMTAFQLNIVGPLDSEIVVLSSGAGTITCSQWGGPLTAGAVYPPCVAVTPHTLENANVVYSTLPALAQEGLSQTFRLG
jgi:hypothetical protein